jgi:hypothetical protein
MSNHREYEEFSALRAVVAKFATTEIRESFFRTESSDWLTVVADFATTSGQSGYPNYLGIPKVTSTSIGAPS